MDVRIENLRSKIGNLQNELKELEKLSSNPENLSRLVKSGLIGENVRFGKVHTQIIIDAEQSIRENVIKVNQI